MVAGNIPFVGLMAHTKVRFRKRIPIKKAKFGVTPPASPSSPVSFKSENGFYTTNIAASPRLISTSSDGGVDGVFKYNEEFRYPEVFTISTPHTGSPGSTLHRNTGSSHNSPTGVRTSNSPEDKYKWTESDATDSPPAKKSRRRHVFCIVALIVLFLGVCAGLAVILAYKVFKAGDVPEEIPPTLRPEFISLYGSLDLIETWDDSLYDPTSSLYIDTSKNFTSEVDTLLSNSSLSDSYISTKVLNYSPGSIKVNFMSEFNQRYRDLTDTSAKLAAMLQQHLIKRAPYSSLRINPKTVKITAVSDKSTSQTTRTSTPATESTESSSAAFTLSSTTTQPSVPSSSLASSSSSPTLSSTTMPSSSSSSSSSSPTTATSTTSSTMSFIITESSTSISANKTEPPLTSTSSSTSTLSSTTSPITLSSTPFSSSTVTLSSTSLSSTSQSSSSPSTSSSISTPTQTTDTPSSSSSSASSIVTSTSTPSSIPSSSTTTESPTTTEEPPTTKASTLMPTSTVPSLCSPVGYQRCSSRGFTQTSYPNLMYHFTEEEAATAMEEAAKPVLNQLCQEAALHYLCSLYFPKCNATTGFQLFPCQSLCNEALTTCGDYFPAPPFHCDVFQTEGCVSLPETTTASPVTTPGPTCEPTRLQECTALGYTETIFPNLIGEASQDDAMITFELYLKNDTLKCGGNAMFLVCGVQFPQCRDNALIKPCKRVCDEVVKTCEAVNWIPCSEYSDYNCMAPQEATKAPRLRKWPFRLVCQAKEFSCQSVYKCIPNDLVCDGKNDCSDWSDEQNCQCNQYEFKCDMGMCVKSFQKCDGNDDCPDRSDELGCDGCTHGQVRCPPNGKCIMSEWLCDGWADCDDGWDERNCDICGRNQFTCADKSCIGLSQICDFHQDCSDGSDEWDCIKEDKNGVLLLPIRKYSLPVCADSWDDSYGGYVCGSLLGQGDYVETTRIPSQFYRYASLHPTGTVASVLGYFNVTYDCPSQRVVGVNCKPKGCGKRLVDPPKHFIVNGYDAKPGAWPWHVALSFGNQYFCGGTLIDRNFVMTAAHCVEKYRTDFQHMNVTLGANNRKVNELTQQHLNVKAIISHTDHVYFRRNDIALLQLSSPANFTDYIQPICLPSETEQLPLYSTCFTIGWGRTQWNMDYSSILQELKMALWDIDKCNSSIAWDGDVYDTFMCAGYYSGIRSVCRGDSGGPLLCMDKQKTWKLYGINSYVANFCNMTARPNIFTNVRNFIPWIQNKTEVKFKCDNGNNLYNEDEICNRVNDCGPNDDSDETRDCDVSVTCNFDDPFLCGYKEEGWELDYNNRQSAGLILNGEVITQSYAPQFDHTVGRYPGHFFFGKKKEVYEARLTSPKFTTLGPEACVRFSYYLRGEINVGLSVLQYEFSSSGKSTVKTAWRSGLYHNSLDEWKTGYFDISYGHSHQVVFITGDLRKAAIDDVVLLQDRCSRVLCDSTTEFWCKAPREDMCIPKQSRCNLAIDCDDSYDEIDCTGSSNSYLCTFENGVLCALRQNTGDYIDWMLVNASTAAREMNRSLIDHTYRTEEGHIFYIKPYGMQRTSHIYMGQLLYTHSLPYCLSFYYQLKSNATFYIHVDCVGCNRRSHIAQPTYGDWTLFQIELPYVDVINITYDVAGGINADSSQQTFVVMDDLAVRFGECPFYACPAGWLRCRTYDRCVPASTRCDRNVDCLDESDEENCVCNVDEFRCSSGRCIPRKDVCDRQPHCLDESDEGPKCDEAYQDVTCNFEQAYLCGYEFFQMASHGTPYAWHRWKGLTLTHQTGPEEDHTLGTTEGYYMYAEANDGEKNDTATMISPPFSTAVGRSLQFWYHILTMQPKHYGPGHLQLILVNPLTSQETLVWTSPSQTSADLDTWNLTCVDLPDQTTLRAKFTATRSEQTIYGVDMAIDDVRLNPARCDACPRDYSRCWSYDHCVPWNALCDRQVDCVDESDEKYCVCNADEFQCTSGRCIPRSSACDRTYDCLDQSDEAPAACDALKDVSCDFQQAFSCGYTFGQSDTSATPYAWHRWKGQTPNSNTGPDSDHTKGDASGYYLYAKGDDGNRNDSASIISPPFTTGSGQSLEFWYHMFAGDPNYYGPTTLQLILEDIAASTETLIWTSNRVVMDIWRRVCVQLPDQVSLRVIFKSTRNGDTLYGADLAIDDIKLNTGPCPDVQTTTKAPTTSGTGCTANQWKCKVGPCIDIDWRCDGASDCPDGSDEKNCF